MQFLRLAAAFKRGLVVAFIGLGGLAGVVSFTGCGEFFTPINTSGTATGSTTYAYVTNVGAGGAGGTLAAYSLTNGVLTALSGSPITLAATPTSIVVAPNNAFLYVGTNLGVFLYTIGTGGGLSEGNSDTIVYLGPSYPKSLAVDSTSSWLIIANNDSTELDALPISPTTGVPTTPTPVSVTLTNPSATQLSISPANTTVSVALGTGGTDVWGFTAANSSPWTKTGTLIDLAKNSTSANAAVMDRTSTYLFIAESTSGTSADVLRQITLSTLGASSVTEVDNPTGKGPSAILPDLSGTYVYVTNQTDNTITGFTIGAGALTAQADSPYGTAKSPLALSEDSTKSYILAVGYGNNPNLWLYKFDATTPGTLDVGTTLSTGTADPALSNAIALTH